MNLVPAKEENEQLVACPICGFTYVHFLTIKVEPIKGDTCWTIRASGIDVRKSGPTGRGTTLTVRFRCENGHVWDSRLRFYRGEIFVTAESVPEFYLRDL